VPGFRRRRRSGAGLAEGIEIGATEGIGQDLFIQGFSDSPFRLIGVTNVKLTPHEAETIDVRGWLASIAPFTVPPGVALNAIDASGAVVYRFAGDRFENITAAYRTKLAASPRVAVAPPRIETGEAGYGYLLGPGWFEPDGGYRWIGKSAQATLGGAIAGQKLFVHGFCAPAQLAAGPLHLSVTPELAAEPATFTIDSCGGSFEFAVALPAALAGRPRFTVLLAVDRAGKIPPDTRELGLAIETMELSY